jgi:hypothetical protein
MYLKINKYYFSAYLLVATGSSSNGVMNNVEIVDPSNSNKVCQAFTNYPLAVEGAFGMLGPQNNPFICGGYFSIGSSKYKSVIMLPNI